MTKKDKQIKEAINVLKHGGVVVFPTETCYGLAADATNVQAVRRLGQIKGRGRKSLPLIASSLAMVEVYTKMSELAHRIARQYWPGPVTIVLPVKAVGRTRLASQCIKANHVAIRVSSNKIATELSKQLRKPIVATSANRAGEPECYSVRSFQRQYASSKLQPDYILDVGALPKRAPSTMVKIDRNRLQVLRQGSIKFPTRTLS